MGEDDLMKTATLRSIWLFLAIAALAVTAAPAKNEVKDLDSASPDLKEAVAAASPQQPIRIITDLGVAQFVSATCDVLSCSYNIVREFPNLRMAVVEVPAGQMRDLLLLTGTTYAVPNRTLTMLAKPSGSSSASTSTSTKSTKTTSTSARMSTVTETTATGPVAPAFSHVATTTGASLLAAHGLTGSGVTVAVIDSGIASQSL